MTSRSPLVQLQRLTEPAACAPEPERRRVRLLSWLHLARLLVTAVALAVALAFNPAGNPLRGRYGALIAGLIAVLLVAYGLNRAGRFSASAWLTVAAAILGPWGSVLLDRSIVSGNFAPLIYTVLPVFLCSILLSVGATMLVAAIQIVGLLFVPIVYPATITSNWPSLMTFVLFMSVISVVAAIITRPDMAQIDRQSRLLAESEGRLRELSVRDALTGLFNRRYLEETLEREVRRAQRVQCPLGVMMMDIDHFKRFTDTYGQAVGDALLRELGALLRANIRRSDIACRYGGEEFILLLPEATPDATRKRAEHFRESAGRISVRHEGQAIEPISLSIGLAAFPQDGSTGEVLLKRADDAWYRAKRAGRDRIARAS